MSSRRCPSFEQFAACKLKPLFGNTFGRSGIAAAVLRAAAAAALRPEATRIITYKDLLRVGLSRACASAFDVFFGLQGGEEQNQVGSSDVIDVMQRMVA